MLIKSTLMGMVSIAMMGMALPALAVSYTPRINSCELTNIGPNKWQAKFNIAITICGGCVNTTNNTMFAYVPKLNSNGKPYGGSASNAVSDAKWGTPSVTGTSVKVNAGKSWLSFTGNNTASVMRVGTSVSVDFSTEGNGAYPAVFVRYTHLPGVIDGFSGWILPNSAGTCHTNSVPPVNLPPIEELIPVEPEFSLKSAVWKMNTVDIDDLPNVAVVGSGYQASIQNVANNNLCVSYVTAGVKNKNYALSVTNSHSKQGGRNLFMMRSGTSQLLYNLKLTSNDGITGNNFNFPDGSTTYITLSQAASSIDKRSEMCWTPQINLYKNATTVAGMHDDILNFVITPKT